MSDEVKLSTSRLAEKAQIDARQLFKLLQEKGWITRDNDQWRLTAHGEFEGGSYQHSDKYGEYIVWPQSLLQHALFANFTPDWLSATRIAEQHHTSPHTINNLLSELGWINKDQRGWMITERGKKLGGEQRNSKHGFFVMWPGQILHNPELTEALANLDGNMPGPCLDGHTVKTAAEKRIDNWLYLNNLAHACQRKLPGSDDTCCFYLPARKIFIEYWGFEDMSHSLSQKMAKQEFYRSHGLKLIEINDEELQQLDEVLPQKLLQFGLQL